MKKDIKTIDEFISTYPPDIQKILQQIRQILHDAAPGAGEKISYGIPTLTLNGNLVHFSAYPNHIGFYPGAAPIAEFAEELKDYNTSKGTIQFPIDKPLPVALIQKIVAYRISQNKSKK